MTNSTKMIEKGVVKHGTPGSHGHNRQKIYLKQKISKNINCIQNVTPIRGKHRQTEITHQPVIQEKKSTKPFSLASPSVSPVQRANSPKLKPVSPSKEGSPRTSPTLGVFYAGARFSEPPSPAALPKPPTHWTSVCMASGRSFPLLTANGDASRDLSNQLKIMLNVSA